MSSTRLITPFNWMTYYSAVGYYVSTGHRQQRPGLHYVCVGYWGIPNFFEVWLTYLWAPYTVYLAYRRWRWRPASVEVAPAQLVDLSSDDALIAQAPAASSRRRRHPRHPTRPSGSPGSPSSGSPSPTSRTSRSTTTAG